MGEAKNSQAEADNLSGRQKADRGRTESTVGESEEGSLKESVITAGGISSCKIALHSSRIRIA